MLFVAVSVMTGFRARSLEEPIESFSAQRGVVIGVGGVTTMVTDGKSTMSAIRVFFRLPRQGHIDFRFFPRSSFPP